MGKKHPPSPPAEDTTERLVKDVATLANDLNATFHAVAKPSADPVVTLQARYAKALIDVAGFLKRRPTIGSDIAGKFEVLADAILGLRKGTVTNPVRPAKAGGRGPDGHIVWGLRADVCIALECLVRAGESQKKAAKYIAKEYPVFERLKRNNRDSLKGSILSWRKHINQENAPAGERRLACQREFFEARSNLSPEEMRAAGEELLQQTARETEKIRDLTEDLRWGVRSKSLRLPLLHAIDGGYQG